MLNFAAQHPATQQERVYHNGFAIRGKNDFTNQPVIAEPVLHMDGQAFRAVAAELLEFVLRTPNRAAVELIGALRQLRNSR